MTTQTQNQNRAIADEAPVVYGSQVSNPSGEDGDEIDLIQLLVKCINHWQWFLVSILLFVAAGVLYILATPKTYVRNASVMITDDKDGNNKGAINALSDIGLFQSTSNVNNEMLAFKSPAIIGEVIQKLGLETDYTVRKGLRNVTLYGDSLPVKISFVDMPLSSQVSMELLLQENGKVDISDMTLNGEKCQTADMTVSVGDTVMTETGKIVITPGPNYIADLDKTIKIRRYSLPEAIEIYNSRLTENLAEEKASVIDFSFKDVNIERADAFLNALIDIYNTKWVDDKAKQALKTSEFIGERLKVIESELGTFDSDIAHYKGEHLVPDVEAASTMYMAKSNENTTRQLEVSTQIAISKYLLDHIKSPSTQGQLLPANSGIDNRGIEAQIQEYNALQLERDKLANTSGKNNPLMQDYDKSLQSMRNALIQSLINQGQTLNTQLNSLIKDDRATNRKIASSPTQAKYLLSVERQQKVMEALYLFLLQKREENELTLAFTPFNTRVITPPMGSNKPVAPKSMTILLACIVAGLVVPAIIIFIADNLDNRLRGRKDIEKVGTPLLGEIPEANGGKSKSRMHPLIRRWRDFIGKTSRTDATPPLLVREHGRSIVNEAFRMLRSNLEFITHNSQKRVIMITSFNPGSGKSFISLNLAAALALKQKGRRVLVIDLDLRRASVSQVLPGRSLGIADYLSEGIDNCDKYIQNTECEGLYILPVGTIPPNPSELLYSDHLKELITRYRQEYDYIFLDCPPAEIVADASIVSPLSDLTLFVIRAGLLDRRMIPEIDRINNSRRYNNLMLILNGTLPSSTTYGRYGYGSYYTKDTNSDSNN